MIGTDGNRTVEPGKVELWIGGGQPVARPGMAQAGGTTASVTVTGRKAIPRF